MKEVLKTQTKELSDIYEEFKISRNIYLTSELINSGEVKERGLLLDLLDDFTSLYEDIRPICAILYGLRTSRDDKACTAIRSRLAKQLIDDEDNKIKSWNMAGEIAPSMPEYQEFLDERREYYENWDSVSHLRDTIKQYIFNINQRLQNL